MISHIFYPQKGGISYHLKCLYNSFISNKHPIIVFNPYFRGKNAYNILNFRNYSIKEKISNLFDKIFIKILLLSIWKIIKDKKLTSTVKLKILLYFFVKQQLLIKTINNVKKLYPYFKISDIDIILGGLANETLPLIFILSRIFNKKVITWTHGNDFLFEDIIITSNTPLFQSLDKIIVGTNHIKSILKNIHNLDDNKIIVINYGLNIEDYKVTKSKSELRNEYKLSNDSFILLSVGHHYPRKRHDLVIKAIKRIKEIYPNIKLKYFLIGKGENTPKLEKLIKDLKLLDEVKLLGDLDEKSRNHYYKISDLFLMPSVTLKTSIEGFGIVFLEANYFKLPVIGSYAGGMIESIDNGKTGLLIKSDDINDLIKKILFFYNNIDERKRFGENGYNRVLKNYNWDKLYKEYIKLFRAL